MAIFQRLLEWIGKVMKWNDGLEIDGIENRKPGMPPGFVEFSLSVPIWELSLDDGGDCAEICAIRRLLGINGGPQTLEELYDSFVDWTKRDGRPGPNMRVNLGDVLLFVADDDARTFLAVDMFNEATDQMNIVGVSVCCSNRHGNEVSGLLTAIRNRAEVSSASLSGNLGITERMQFGNFPRLVSSGAIEVPQHMAIYRGGAIISTSRTKS